MNNITVASCTDNPLPCMEWYFLLSKTSDCRCLVTASSASGCVYIATGCRPCGLVLNNVLPQAVMACNKVLCLVTERESSKLSVLTLENCITRF